jgi:hypothetical protein
MLLYLLILAFLILGIGFHVGLKIAELDKLTPNDPLGAVFKMLWEVDKITILISVFLIIPFIELVFFCAHKFWLDLMTPKELEESIFRFFDVTFLGISVIMGYQGQRLLYGALGKAVDFAEKKINDKLQSHGKEKESKESC